jgi:putative peptide zinc metalloprotease protein
MRERLRHFTKLQLAVVAGIVVLGMTGAATYEGWSDDGQPTPTATATASAEAIATAVINEFEVRPGKRGGGPSNRVTVHNEENGRFRTRASLDYAAVKGPSVAPENFATAEATCTDCQTIAIAGQIVIYERGASSVTPRNIAKAVNTRCTRCVTIALAYQYLIPVDDVDNAPDNARRLVREMDREFKEIEKIRSISETTPEYVEARINDILNRFQEYAQYLYKTRDEQRVGDGTATPTPTESATASPTPEASPTATATPEASVTPQASATPPVTQ